MESKGKILVIDDDLDIVEAIKMVLEAEGYQVLGASDIENGQKKIEEEKPHLIILDVMMNRLDDGFVLAQNLKRHPDYSTIPILMLTAVIKKTGFPFSPETDGEWLAVDDFVEKPIQPDALIEKVAMLLSKRRNP